MTDEKLKELNEKLRRLDVETDVPEKEEEKKPARGGIAVVNVNRRIRLLFGEEYGIHVYSKEGIGTDVIVELPLVRDGDRQGGWRCEKNFFGYRMSILNGTESCSWMIWNSRCLPGRSLAWWLGTGKARKRWWI